MKKHLPIALLLVCVAAFVAGVVWLFKVRFESGDVYPKYSSLRADPLGTMALYESLEKIPELNVRRDFTSAGKLPEENNTTYLHLAGNVYDWKRLPRGLVENIEDFLTRGGRLVVAFYPLNAKPFAPPQDSDESDPDKPKETKEKKKAKPGDTSRTNSVSLRQQWGVEFGFDFLESGQGDSYEPVIVLNKTEFPLPGMIEWHSSIIFTNLDSKWRTVYARGTNAVVIERRYGRGSIVMATDSYFLSNEALWKERHPALLTWLVGPNRSIVFDESHFGIMEGGGVAILMRKYRLHGLIGGFVLLAALFVWKNSLSLVQPYDDEQQGKFVTGKGTAAGFVNLLRRNIPATNVLNTCGNEWKKSYPQKTAHAAARVQQVQAVLDAENSKSGRDRDPIGAYQQICRILKRSNSCLNKEPRMDTNEHE